MRLIHCADIHLDAALRTRGNQAAARQRRQEILKTFLDMIAYGAERQVQAVLIAGDLFDTEMVSATVRQAVLDAVESHPDMEFYYLEGNHDGGSFLSGLETVPGNLHLFSDQWKSYALNPDSGGRIVLTGMELTPENSAAAAASLTLNPRNFNIVMLHGQQTRYEGQGAAEQIPLAALAGHGIDYLALGHIHSHQEGRLDARGTWAYPGCLEGRGFDECGVHGFLLLDIDEENMTMRRNFVPAGKRRLWEIPVDVSGCDNSVRMGEKIDQVLTARMDPIARDKRITADDLIRVVLTGRLPLDGEKNTAFLEQQWRDRFYWFEIKDQTGVEIDYTAFRLDASLKGEFVRTVEEDTELEPEEKAAVIRCGILALAGEEDDTWN